MPKIREFDAGDIGFNPTGTGVEATAATARRVGAFFNQQAGATETLARETERLGRETARLGSDTQALGRETGQLGDYEGRLMSETGRRIGSAIEFAGDQAVKYLDHQQVSQGAVAFSNLMMRKTAEWNETVKNADPNDPTVAQRFMAKSVEPDLEEFKSNGFYTENGQKWAESHVDALRKHFGEKTMADMSIMAGHAAVVNQKQTINSLSNTVRSDPTSLSFALGAMESGTEGVLAASPNLKGTDAARIRSEILQQGKESIIKSAALGSIEKTGTVPDWVTDPKYSPYVNGAELKQLAQAAKYYQRLNQSEDRSARVQRDYELKLDFNNKVNELEASTMPRNVGDPPQLPSDYWQKMRELSTHPGAALEPGRLKTMVTNGETITARLDKPEPLARVSHATTVELLGDIRDGKITDTTAIYEKYREGKLSNSDLNFSLKAFVDQRSPEGQRWSAASSDLIKAVKPAIDKSNPLMGKIDQDGPMNLYRFQMDLERKKIEYIKAGKDPHDLLDPSKPDFMGKPEAMAPYQKTLAESTSDAARRLMGKPSVNMTGDGSTVISTTVTNVPPPAPRKPGESPDAYLKRMGIK